MVLQLMCNLDSAPSLLAKSSHEFKNNYGTQLDDSVHLLHIFRFQRVSG